MKPVQLPSFMSIGTMVIELREFKKKKKKDTMWKLFNLKQKWYLSEIFGTQFGFDMSSAVEVKLAWNWK